MMSAEQVSNGTAVVFSELALYVMAVAEKYGQQEAFDLLASTFDQYGTHVGGMLKQQLEGKEGNAQDIYGIVAPLEESVGFALETVDSAASKVTFRVGRCPLYEGCQAVGAPDEEFCNSLGLPFVNGLARAINPKAEWKDVRHRASADDYCLEEITIH